ncbi:MAG TPA: IS5/IS1182 family transposase, partial [Deltaproteobacteria bacterium]|nr:IS5/IS1182 family transposase [Deltaproteobacteria bacterium]
HTRLLLKDLQRSPNLKRICGFSSIREIPSESTFSRAFFEFAKDGLGEKVHKVLVESHLKAELVGHISRDSTAIEGREKAAKKEKKEKVKKKKGRPKKGEIREAKEEKRLDRQINQSFEESLKELPTVCDIGSKKNSKGYLETWKGYKLHIDVSDCGLPVSAVLTSASVHDSQAAIPMIKMTSARVDYLYDVMDAAYDAGQIYETSRTLGHVPLIDRNSRGKESIPMAPHEAVRYNERTVAERLNSRIKEDFGARNVMVKGAEKVKTHLMFGLIVLFADQLLKLAN